ncbi:alternative ribosome rescue aminoacyl-tRNA hydrolase ArfB [Phycicoccus avicenniae]|uniref:alternative ribosome rescue aminoacyl-tRNA hydrolase ArfB n=1 Tax=Phycicoccus avicenniae TaxID=2828860 RepID=UPI003D2CA523
MDLVIPPGPGVPQGITIPAADLVERFSRSSGPGGQGVNTADSRVELELDLAATPHLTEAQRRRALTALGTRLVDGRLVVAASEHRQQRRNRVAARDRMAALLREALAPPPPARRATRPTRGSVRRRLDAKRRRGETKAARGRPSPEA